MKRTLSTFSSLIAFGILAAVSNAQTVTIYGQPVVAQTGEWVGIFSEDMSYGGSFTHNVVSQNRVDFNANFLMGANRRYGVTAFAHVELAGAMNITWNLHLDGKELDEAPNQVTRNLSVTYKTTRTAYVAGTGWVSGDVASASLENPGQAHCSPANIILAVTHTGIGSTSQSVNETSPAEITITLPVTFTRVSGTHFEGQATIHDLTWAPQLEINNQTAANSRQNNTFASLTRDSQYILNL